MSEMIGKAISHYHILEELGQGGMGIVYKAEDTRLRRTVALKFLAHNFTATAEDRARFQHEAQAAATLNHPNICTIHAIDEYEGQQFIEMEFLDGSTLREKPAPVAPAEAAGIVLQIAEGLSAAHAKGIIHRDIKSENIMLTRDGRAKIMDFGLARLRGNLRLTRAGATIGTIAYMSPEQIQDRDVDERADIWSLGIILYELLSGKSPFGGQHEAATIYSILNLDPPVIIPGKGEIPDGLTNLMRAMLQKDRDLRPRSCSDILLALKRIENGSDPGIEVRTRHEKKSIAVLPFANLSPDPDNEFFSDGITEELIASLSKLDQLRVCSRSMAFQYKGKLIDPRQVGKDLLASVILEGSVRRLGNRVRIAAELTDTSNGFQLWADSYDRQIDDVFAVQDEIARTIIDALQVQLSVSEQSTMLRKYKANAKAYEEYLRGRFWLAKRTREGTERSISHFENAIRIDAAYAIAYTDLAICYYALANYAWLDTTTASKKALECVTKAQKLEPNLDGVHLGLAGFAQVDFDFEESAKQYRRTLQINPSYDFAHHCLAFVHLARGNFREALRENAEAQRLEPLVPIIYAYEGFIYLCMKEYETGLEKVQKSIDIEPDFAQGYHLKSWLFTMSSRFDEALGAIANAEKIWGEHNQLLAVKGVVYARMGEGKNARDVRETLRRREKSGIFVHPYDYALIEAGLGDADATLARLEEAAEVRFYWWFTVFNVHPLFEFLRGDGRYRQLAGKLNLSIE
jgi:serine/threonine protein kinase